MSDTGEKYRVRWYRSTIFSALLVAATAFTCPGIFGALNGMGAGGGASPDVSNAANAIVFGVLAVGSPFVGAVVNRITPKYGLLVSNHVQCAQSPNGPDVYVRSEHWGTPPMPPGSTVMTDLARIGCSCLPRSSWVCRPASCGSQAGRFSWDILKRTEKELQVSGRSTRISSCHPLDMLTWTPSVGQVWTSITRCFHWRHHQSGAQHRKGLARFGEQRNVYRADDRHEFGYPFCARPAHRQSGPKNGWPGGGACKTTIIGKGIPRDEEDFETTRHPRASASFPLRPMVLVVPMAIQLCILHRQGASAELHPLLPGRAL